MLQLRKQELALRKKLQQLRILHPGSADHDLTHSSTQISSESELSPTSSTKSIEEAEIDSKDKSITDIHSALESQIFERSVQHPPHSRSQSFSSISSIPAHLTQEAMVPSVLDASCALDDDAPSVEVICGHSGHPLSKRRTTSFSGLSFNAVQESSEEQPPAENEIDYSDHTRLNFTSFADLLGDEEEESLHTSPLGTRKNSVVIVPLSLKSTEDSRQ